MKQMKKTKIVATFGPAIASQKMVSRLAAAGVNLFRINCSHGTTADFVKAAGLIRRGTREAPFPVGLLFDISGPKLRLERFSGELPIRPGEELTLSATGTDLEKKIIAVNHPAIISSIKKGERVFLDDGTIIFEARTAGRKQVVLKAVNGGTVLPGKGINLPDSNIAIPTISDKDRADIATAVKLKADYIALSFVRTGDDIIEARQVVKSCGGKQDVIAKLEKREAIENLENIMLVSDGVMVARGDLGVELPFEELPRLQKRIINIANRHHKPVIVATQMLESMRFSPRATRAEVNDVASAVFSHVDAVMLSAETATGKYPLETVRAMRKVIEASEKDGSGKPPQIEGHLIKSEITHAIAQAVSESTGQCPTKLIFAFTASGFTASVISNLFPKQPVIALTPRKEVLTKLSLMRSVYPVMIRHPKSFDEMVRQVKDVCRRYKLARTGDRVIITGGAPFGSNVGTNFMMFYELGKNG